MRDFSVIAIFERKFFYMSEEIEIKDEVLDLKVTETYDENQIQVLEGLEAVRKRPGMYIGSTSARGLHHLVYEIVDNSIDEALAGYCTHIEVTIEKGDIIRVTDNGRGIPCGIHPQMGIPTLEVVLTVRQVRRLGLQGFRRPARRRLVGCKRAVRLARSRGTRRPHQALYAL